MLQNPHPTRWAVAGQRVAKIAGSTLARSGKLLGP